MNLLTDTTPEAQRVLTESYRRMSPERRWRVMRDAYRMTRALHEAGFRMRNPDASRRMIQADWRRMNLGPLWQPAFAEVPEVDAESLDNLPVIRDVTAALRQLGARFALGGSWATSMQGEARAPRDADITAEPFPGREAEFAAAFGSDYY